MFWLLPWACVSPSMDVPSVLPADRAALRRTLTFPGQRGEPEPSWGEVWEGDGYVVRVVALDARPGFRVGGALFEPEAPTSDGVLMAHGHFDAGKSSVEAQDLAHRLAGAGVAVLLVDNPGMEEWGGPDRALHFGRGAHNRAWLHAGGTSPLSLQLAALRGGLDLLESEGVRNIVATGASGGASLSFWLSVLDDRVGGVVLAAVPDVPRGPEEGGCPCKLVPGLPGPDPSVVATLAVPSLWLKESDRPAPVGLPGTARYVHVPGPHRYTDAMQRAALEWILDHLDRRRVAWRASVPNLELRTLGKGERREHRRLWTLPLAPKEHWTPRPVAGLRSRQVCSGEGPAVVMVGGQEVDRLALEEGGFRACALELGEDPRFYAAAVTKGEVAADRIAGLVRAAFEETDAVAAWGVGGFGVAVAGSGVPFVLREPPLRPEDLDLAIDPEWAHVPGIWWGGAPGIWAKSLAIEAGPDLLVAALQQGLTEGSLPEVDDLESTLAP